MVALSVYRESNVRVDACNSSCLVLQLQSAVCLEQRLRNRECSWTIVSVNGNEKPRWRHLSAIQFSCNCNYFLITHNKNPVQSTWGLLSSELHPSWEQHPRYVPHRVHARYDRYICTNSHSVVYLKKITIKISVLLLNMRE